MKKKPEVVPLKEKNKKQTLEKKVSNKKIETKKNKKSKKLKKRLYFSYEFRTIFCLIAFFLTILTSLYLITISINYSKTEKINYSEESNIDYKVYLKDNNFYETEFLEKDMLYVASLIDKIKIDFNYLFKTDNLQNISFKYSVLGKLTIKDNQTKKIYYEKNYQLLDEHYVHMNNENSQSIIKNININYDYYNSLANSFKSAYGVDTESTLTIYMLIQKESNDEHSHINSSNSVMNITIPLSEKSVEIKLDYNEINQKSEIINNPEKFIINEKNLLISTVLILISIIYLIKFIRKISILNKNNKFNKQVKKILKNYDRLIVESKNLVSFEGKEVIKLNKFTELLDVHDNLQLPIMYCNITKEIKSFFYIVHNDIIYLYVIKAVDLGDNKNDK